jgi:hypothetical protein
MEKIVYNYWLSSTIRVEDVKWGDQNEDGKTKSIFRVKWNRP